MDKISNTEKVMKALLESKVNKTKKEEKKVIRVIKESNNLPVTTKTQLAREVHAKYGKGARLDNNPGNESSFPVSYKVAKQIIRDYNLTVLKDSPETEEVEATGSVATTKSNNDEIIIGIAQMDCIIYVKYKGDPRFYSDEEIEQYYSTKSNRK